MAKTINPLLAVAGLGTTTEVTDVAEGRDEQLLRDGIDPVKGWSRDPDVSANTPASPDKVI